MKSLLLAIITLAIGAGAGFFGGHEVGMAKMTAEYRSRTYNEIVSELRQRELLSINSFVNGDAKIKTIDEGGLFRVKNVSYLVGQIENKALATDVKDVQLRIDYLSETGAVISSEEITIYKIISAGRTKEFKEKINIPGKTQSFSFTIVAVRSV